MTNTNTNMTHDSKVINFGKHKGKTIDYIKTNDKNYFDWLKKTICNDNSEKWQALRALLSVA